MKGFALLPDYQHGSQRPRTDSHHHILTLRIGSWASIKSKRDENRSQANHADMALLGNRKISLGIFTTTVLTFTNVFLQVRSGHVAPIYIINLLITDLIQLCYMIVEMATPKDVEIPVIFFNIYFFGLFASVYFMVCIALERYLVIAHPLWYRFRRTVKISVGVCVLVWALSLVCVIPLYFWNGYVTAHMIFAVVLLLPFALLIFFLVGTLRALSAAISVHSDEKRRIVGILVLVLLIYTLLFLPTIIGLLALNVTLFKLSVLFVRLSPLADLVLYFFMRKGVIDKLLVSVCCCRMDSNDISS
ncbi:G-protein coupled receptor 4-like, partial [Micropterus salmoides]|uniref:G-protein coupled receptor 4-like n=1 Tax=Micropterus salmoides TaxID=27706 RepID=UPI0018EC2710